MRWVSQVLSWLARKYGNSDDLTQASVPSSSPRRLSRAVVSILVFVGCLLGHEFLRVAGEGAIQFLARDFEAPVEQQLVTKVGEQRRLALPDGSVVVANTSSDVEVKHGKKIREIEVRKGEVLLHIQESEHSMHVVIGNNILEAGRGTARVHWQTADVCEIYAVNGEFVSTSAMEIGDPRCRKRCFGLYS